MENIVRLLIFTSLTCFAVDAVLANPEPADREPTKAVVEAALISGVEFNRLRDSVPDFKSAGTVEAALDSLVACEKPMHKALIKENLAKYRAEVVPLLIMQNGQLSGAPALNKILAGAQTATLEAKNRRNAQSIISIFNAARAAGCRELDGVKSAAQAAALIRTGVSGAGQFSATRFQVTLDDPSLKAAIDFITYDPQKGLSYNENVELVSDQASAPASSAPDAVAVLGARLKREAEVKAEQPAR